MKKIFLSFVFVFVLCLYCVQAAQAKVYLIGRNIDIATDSYGFKYLLAPWGHSFLLIIPDNPQELAAALAEENVVYAEELEQIFIPGINGFTIGGYPGNGSDMLLQMDGDLLAVINHPTEKEAVRDWLRRRNQKLWDFVGGEVLHDGQTDTQFILAILKNTWTYQKQPEKPDYNAVGSMLEHVLSPQEQRAQNCNALAFSLLAYSNATDAPDIGATRTMPGNHTLLPRYFFKGTEFLDAQNMPQPPLVKNHKAYEKRKVAVERRRELLQKTLEKEIMKMTWDLTFGQPF